jgi:aminopeptidase YwaD
MPGHRPPAAEERFAEDLQRLVRERHPHASPAALRETADYLHERFAAMGLTVARHPFPALDGRYENIVASLTGNDSDAAPVIVAAHYDTVAGSPGADDNASALAVLLDVAGHLRGLGLRRPVQFIAFCLEEHQLLGSRAHAAQLAAAGQSIAGAIVLECVGYASNAEGSQKSPPGIPIDVPTTGNFLAVIGNERSEALTGSVARAMGQCLPIVPLIVPGNGERLPDTRRSDHTAFWEQGFPAVMLTDTADFRNPHYHQPTDRLDTLDLHFMASVADGLAAAVRALTGKMERP